MMALSALIHKNKSKQVATATLATPATHDGQTGASVANVASVAVANPQNSKMTETNHAQILAWLAHIGEDDKTIIDDVIGRCQDDADCMAYFLKRACA